MISRCRSGWRFRVHAGQILGECSGVQRHQSPEFMSPANQRIHHPVCAIRAVRAGLLVVWLVCGLSGSAAEPVSPSADHTSKAMALIRANCLSCHNPEKSKGGLVLSSQAAAVAGGDSGPAVKPGQAAESLFIQVLAAKGDPHMPPKKQLEERQIATLRSWIEAGAAWDEKVLNAPTSLEVPADFGPLPDGYQPILAVALSPDETTLAIGRGGRIYLHDVSKAERPLIKELDGHRDAVQSLAWSGDGKHLASGGFRQVQVWNTADWEPAGTITNELRGRITAMTFTTNHQSLILADSVAAESGWIRQVALDGTVQFAWQAHGDAISCLDLSRDGRLLATAGTDRLGKLWELSSQKELARLERHDGHLLAIAFNPDASWVATGATDKLLKIWDAKTYQEIISDNGPGSTVTGLHWAADGKSLVSSGEDGAPRIFTEFKPHTGAASSSGVKDRKLTGVDEALNAVTMTRDGKTIYGGGQDGVLYIWSSDGKVQGKLTVTAPSLADAGKAAQ